MDFDKAKFLTLSPKSQRTFIDELSQIMKETPVADHHPQCPSTPPQRAMETKRALQSPETPYRGESKKVI